MKRSEIIKKDIQTVKTSIQMICEMKSRMLKDASGIYMVDTDEATKALLWLKHELEGKLDFFLLIEKLEDK